MCSSATVTLPGSSPPAPRPCGWAMFRIRVLGSIFSMVWNHARQVVVSDADTSVAQDHHNHPSLVMRPVRAIAAETAPPVIHGHLASCRCG